MFSSPVSTSNVSAQVLRGASLLEALHSTHGTAEQESCEEKERQLIRLQRRVLGLKMSKMKVALSLARLHVLKAWNPSAPFPIATISHNFHWEMKARLVVQWHQFHILVPNPHLFSLP